MSATPSLAQTFQDTIEARLTGLHTMLPGKVVSVDVAAGKCDVQPLIKRVNADGVVTTLPIITNCPIGFYRASKAAVYLPLKVGDGVEIRFCERSLDIWLSKGGTVDPDDARKHNLSDAVAYPGLYDFTNPPTDAHPDNLVIVNDQIKITQEPTGTILIENPAASITMDDQGNFELENDEGNLHLTKDGKFQFQGAADELLETLIDVMQTLITAVTPDPLSGDQIAFTPSTILDLQAEKARLEGLKE